MIEDLKTIHFSVFVSLLLIGVLDDLVYFILSSNGFELARTKSVKVIRENYFYKLLTNLTPLTIIGIAIYCFWLFHWVIPILIFLLFGLGKAISKSIHGINATIHVFINENLFWIYVIQPFLIGYVAWFLIFV